MMSLRLFNIANQDEVAVDCYSQYVTSHIKQIMSLRVVKASASWELDNHLINFEPMTK